MAGTSQARHACQTSSTNHQEQLDVFTDEDYLIVANMVIQKLLWLLANPLDSCKTWSEREQWLARFANVKELIAELGIEVE